MIYAAWLGSNYFTAPLKYLVQTIKTLWILLLIRPRGVLVMAPPVVACISVWMYCMLFRAQFAIDGHTGAFLNPRWQRLRFIQKFFSRRAATTIVTNNYLRETVESWGAHSTIVPDVPVHFPDPESVILPQGVNMTLVASFCPDEPIAEFLEAAAKVRNVNFYITGNYKKLNQKIIEKAPGNVQFLGFISRQRYTGLLLESDAVIALTTRDHTMQRAAYEAIYLKRAVITSDFQVLRESFPRGTVHVKPTASSIQDGICRIAANLSEFQAAAESLRSMKLERWQDSARMLLKSLGFSAPQDSTDSLLADSQRLTGSSQ